MCQLLSTDVLRGEVFARHQKKKAYWGNSDCAGNRHFNSFLNCGKMYIFVMCIICKCAIQWH